MMPCWRPSPDWVVGFIVAAVFAILAYLFYLFAVAIVSYSLGYAAAVGLLSLIGMQFGFIVWVIGLVAGIALAAVVLRFNIQKIVIELATAFLGAGTIVGVFLALFGGLPTSELIQNPVAAALKNSPFWMIVFIVLGIVAFVAQWQNNRSFEQKTYNRMAEPTP